MHREIDGCASRVKGKLYFPSTITQLCLSKGVRYSDEEETVKNSGIINTIAMARINKDEEPPLQQPDSPAPATDPAAASNSIPQPEVTQLLDQLAANQQNMMAMLQHMEEQQHAYWKYARVRDNNIKLALQRNFSKPYPPIPPFPADIFQPWQPEPEPEQQQEEGAAEDP